MLTTIGGLLAAFDPFTDANILPNELNIFCPVVKLQ